MPNIQSQMKRVKTNRKSGLANSQLKSKIKNSIKKLELAVVENDTEKADELFNTANSLLDKSMTRHIHHKNYVRRKKAHLASLHNELKS
ncbi:30S ribosomal protein S20 [Erysipelothrix urinaevulpis]|uniref:30S ribosomal protein S20 n=1 Tax=Erysipelothrix urinaevulpis TaxID=2683717 RepID=UPI00135C4B67|nr:30S ribosomal protein S20 [Erysipelothrix urinaevulpis]